MGTTEIVAISIFGLLMLAAVALGLRQGRKQRERAARYSLGHGFTVLRAGDARLAALLEQVAPDSNFSPHTVMLVEPAPNAVYLFGCYVRPKERSSKASSGYACLAEHAANRPEWPVTIFTRTPMVDKLVRDRVEAGGEEFRRMFTVTCSNAGAALVTVSVDVQRILLDHAAGPGWYLSVTIAGRGVLVESHWAQTEEEWDYLIALAKKLRAAVR